MFNLINNFLKLIYQNSAENFHFLIVVVDVTESF